MILDLTGFEEYLKNKHYSKGFIYTSKNIARRLLSVCTEEEIISTDARELIERFTDKSFTNNSRRIYASKVKIFKEYLREECK